MRSSIVPNSLKEIPANQPKAHRESQPPLTVCACACAVRGFVPNREPMLNPPPKSSPHYIPPNVARSPPSPPPQSRSGGHNAPLCSREQQPLGMGHPPTVARGRGRRVPGSARSPGAGRGGGGGGGTVAPQAKGQATWATLRRGGGSPFGFVKARPRGHWSARPTRAMCCPSVGDPLGRQGLWSRAALTWALETAGDKEPLLMWC